MRLGRLALPAAVVLAACSDPAPPKRSGGSTATVPAGVASAPSSASASDSAAPPPLPVDPAILALLEAGIPCAWSEGGLPQGCKAAEALEAHVKANKNEATLSGCLGALADPRPHVRMMVGTCLYQYKFVDGGPAVETYSARVFDAILPAIARETEPNGRPALARAVSQHSATSAKRSGAVVELIQKLDREKEGYAIGTLLDTLYEGDGQGSTTEPAKAVVDCAVEGSKSPSGWAQRAAFKILGRAPSRAAELCPLLVARAEKGAGWREAVGAVADLEGACVPQHGAVADAIVGHLERAAEPKHEREDDVGSMSEMLTFVGRDAVAKEHKDKIAKAAEKLARAPKLSAVERDYVTTLATKARAAPSKPGR